MIRSRTSDRTLIVATVVLLIAEVTWLLMHLQIIPNPFKVQSVRLEQKAAGFVVKYQNELRKRRINSLLWESSDVDDTLYYYDSVLTLAQSSATLHLQEQTEVHLSENTLVTIEPQDANSDSQIRLKFTRGDLRARNPYATTRIETKEWSLNLDQGSEVSLRQTGSDDYEVEVLKGNLNFEKDSGKEALGENQVLKIENNKVSETLHVEKSLKFEGPEYQRIYSYKPEASVPVSWLGEAEKIQIVPLGKTKVIQEVDAASKTKNLALEPGKYTLRLMKNGKISEAKEIEIWQAPTLQLLSPFPRDRVKTNEAVSFVWTYLPEAKEYKFVVTNLTTGKVTEKVVKTNSVDFNFLDEADVQWKVIGIDRDGFEMPAPYANQIFPRNEPFAAPKLKSPELRVPASKKKSKPDSQYDFQLKPVWALLWQSLFSTAAFASEETRKSTDYEAVFAWEVVPGADVYTIEISDSADFQSPLLSKVVKKTEFTWTQFQLGTYYWRVAAGSSTGRMGVFSDPAKVQLEKLPENSSDRGGVLIRKKPQLEKQRAPVVTKTEDILENAPKPQFDEKRFDEPTKLVSDSQREIKTTFLLEWTPVVTTWTLNGENQLKAALNGSSTGGAHLQTEQLLSKEHSYFIDAYFAQYKWSAKDLTAYPFQEEQSMTDARLQVLIGDDKSSLLRGAILQTVPYIERKDLEKLEIHNALTIGPSVYYTWINSERWKSGHSLSLMTGSQVFALSTQNAFRYLYYKGEQTALSIGFRFQGDLVFYQRSFSNGWSTGLTLGFEH
jgi:hypothetical protein